MRITFHGAAGDVTGSCHLVEAAGKRILVDCGMFQGSRALDQENAGDFGFDSGAVDLLLLTHAHLDHCGRIPLLYKRGFRGAVLTTAATAELAKLVMLDAAGLQREELRRPDRNHRNGHNGHSGHPDAAVEPPPEPLYDENDVQAAMQHFQGRMTYGQPADLFPGVRATFFDAGHILGSAYILLELEEDGRKRRLVFSGDLGNRERPLLNPPVPAPTADVIVMESTYGDRNHKGLADSVTEFQGTVAATLKRGGNVVVPTFALERAQELLYFLRDAVERNVIPAATPVYLDSPMAISATEIFRRHADLFNAPTRALLTAGHDPFAVPGLHFTRDRASSMAINNIHGGAVIMAGSGMASGGRVLHHLLRNLERPECCVLIVGYAAAGTVARHLVDKTPTVRILGQTLQPKAQVVTIGGFSAHADHDGLVAWAKGGGAGARVFLVHGEDDARAKLATDLQSAGVARIERPGLNQAFPL